MWSKLFIIFNLAVVSVISVNIAIHIAVECDNQQLLRPDNGRISFCYENQITQVIDCVVECEDGYTLERTEFLTSSVYRCDGEGWTPNNMPRCIGMVYLMYYTYIAIFLTDFTYRLFDSKINNGLLSIINIHVFLSLLKVRV